MCKRAISQTSHTSAKHLISRSTSNSRTCSRNHMFNANDNKYTQLELAFTMRVPGFPKNTERDRHSLSKHICSTHIDPDTLYVERRASSRRRRSSLRRIFHCQRALRRLNVCTYDCATPPSPHTYTILICGQR